MLCCLQLCLCCGGGTCLLLACACLPGLGLFWALLNSISGMAFIILCGGGRGGYDISEGEKEKKEEEGRKKEEGGEGREEESLRRKRKKRRRKSPDSGQRKFLCSLKMEDYLSCAGSEFATRRIERRRCLFASPLHLHCSPVCLYALLIVVGRPRLCLVQCRYTVERCYAEVGRTPACHVTFVPVEFSAHHVYCLINA